jgi:hypothetical protein
MKLNIDPAKKSRFKVHIRIPGWSTGKNVPGDLYRYAGPAPRTDLQFRLNGKAVPFTMTAGYAVIEQTWKKGDRLEWSFDMPAVQVVSRVELKQNSERTAIQRGPLVYCVEGTDNDNAAWNIILPGQTQFSEEDYSVSGEKVVAVTAKVPVVVIGKDGRSAATEVRKVTAIPYYAWANRGKTEMQVWLPTSIRDLKINY